MFLQGILDNVTRKLILICFLLKRDTAAMKLIFVLTLAFSFIVKAEANTLLDNANTSLNYLLDHVIPAERDEFSEEKAVAAIRDISLALNHLDLSEDSVILLRTLRVHSTLSVNKQRALNNKTVDVTLSLGAIKDVEFVLNQPNDSKDANLTYSAGHIAMHHLKDTILAYEYWNQCAELGHAGCMNIMASETFTGANGSSIDINKSIHWHRKVFETGIEYNCAGSYSANMLSSLAFFFPKLNTSGDWNFWKEKRDALIEELEVDLENLNFCSKECFYLRDYVLNFGLGKQNKDLLSDAITAAEEKEVIDVLSSIYGEANVQATLSLIDKVPSTYEKCDLTFNLLLLSKYQNNAEAEVAYSDYLYLLNRENCGTELSIIQRLKDQGRWSNF